jgi:hypothetical protein
MARASNWWSWNLYLTSGTSDSMAEQSGSPLAQCGAQTSALAQLHQGTERARSQHGKSLGVCGCHFLGWPWIRLAGEEEKKEHSCRKASDTYSNEEVALDLLLNTTKCIVEAEGDNNWVWMGTADGSAGRHESVQRFLVFLYVCMCSFINAFLRWSFYDTTTVLHILIEVSLVAEFIGLVDWQCRLETP